VRNFRLGCVATLQLGLATTMLIVAVMDYLQLVRGFSALLAGAILLPMAASAIAAAPAVSKHTGRRREWLLVMAGFAIFTVCLVALAVVGSERTPLALLVVISALFGLGARASSGP
jgi:Na+/melibiose symporter-like transporter